MGTIDTLGWCILVAVLLIIGVPNLIFALRLRANPDWQSPNIVIAIKMAGIMTVILLPLMCIVLSDPPLAAQSWLGLIQFLYLILCYFVLWIIWKRAHDWRMKFCLLILFIFLPDYLWIMHLAALDRIPRAVGAVQLVYLVSGYFVFKHYFSKIHPQSKASTDQQ